jgi:hypothetical protein
MTKRRKITTSLIISSILSAMVILTELSKPNLHWYLIAGAFLLCMILLTPLFWVTLPPTKK